MIQLNSMVALSDSVISIIYAYIIELCSRNLIHSISYCFFSPAKIIHHYRIIRTNLDFDCVQLKFHCQIIMNVLYILSTSSLSDAPSHKYERSLWDCNLRGCLNKDQVSFKCTGATTVCPEIVKNMDYQHYH